MEIKNEETESELSKTNNLFDSQLSIVNLLSACKASKSTWFIPPLQDLLYINKKYWKENAEDERINVPGSVNPFNWTYRIPARLEDLLEDKELCKIIKEL